MGQGVGFEIPVSPRPDQVVELVKESSCLADQDLGLEQICNVEVVPNGEVVAVSFPEKVFKKYTYFITRFQRQLPYGTLRPLRSLGSLHLD